MELRSLLYVYEHNTIEKIIFIEIKIPNKLKLEHNLIKKLNI